MNEFEMMRRVRIIVEKLVSGEMIDLPYCSSAVCWQINKSHLRNTDKKLLRSSLGSLFIKKDIAEHGHYSVQTLDRVMCIVYGNFCVRNKEHISGFYGYPYEISVILQNGIAERIILHGGREEPIFCIIQSDQDHLYMLRESEILYIEASHNDLIWHCMDSQVKERGSLKEMEGHLPEYFYRLHRSYIVNVNHIKCLQERELTIDNGDKLFLPVRNYTEKRERIRQICAKWLASPRK